MEAIIAKWMAVGDTGGPGRVHGGVIMHHCDEAAALAAMRHCQCSVVTAGVDRLSFLQPAYIGELVSFRAHVNAAWTTSMEVGIKVTAENVMTGEIRHVVSAYYTMVALDANGKPTAIEPIEVVDETTERRYRAANVRRTGRLNERAQLLDKE